MSLLTSMPPAPVHPRVDSTGDRDQGACNALLGRRGDRLEAPACRLRETHRLSPPTQALPYRDQLDQVRFPTLHRAVEDQPPRQSLQSYV